MREPLCDEEMVDRNEQAALLAVVLDGGVRIFLQPCDVITHCQLEKPHRVMTASLLI
jgi:hypothetical protein